MLSGGSAKALFLVLLMSGLAGCAGGDEPASEADDEGEAVEVRPGVTVAPGTGLVEGRVTSDSGLVIAGARVSILGTPAFTDTNESGGFLLLDVEAGEHTLQVQEQGFQTHQETIEVTGGTAVHRNITLVPDLSGGAGYRPHTHDYWRGQDHVVLMDEAWFPERDENNRPSDTDRVQRAYWSPNTNQTYFPITLPDEADGRPALVYPGTAEVRVTFTWEDSSSNLDELGLMVRTPAGGDRAYLAPRASGESWSIQTTPAMTDFGHQTQSLWMFALYNANSATGSTTSWSPAYLIDDIHVKIEVFRGQEPPLEPPHPDFWGDGDAIPLNTTGELVWDLETCDPRTPYYNHIELDDGAIVPPGTTHLRLVFTYELRSPVDDATDRHYILTWRSAEQHEFQTPVGDFHHVEPIEVDGRTQVYEVPLEEVQTDAFYQTFSLWSFVPADPEDREQECDPSYGGARSFTLEATALRRA